MGWLIVVSVVIVLALAPSFLADTRTGGDWKPLTLSGSERAFQPARPFSQSPGALAVRRVMVRVLRTRGGRPATSARAIRRGLRHSAPSKA